MLPLVAGVVTSSRSYRCFSLSAHLGERPGGAARGRRPLQPGEDGPEAAPTRDAGAREGQDHRLLTDPTGGTGKNSTRSDIY